MRITIVIAALWLSVCLTGTAAAQCCGGAPTMSYYQPAAYTAYSPVAYTTYRTGWYPGYFFDRIRTRLFGSPSTYVAAYPSTYVASYPSTYTAAYPSYPSTYVASYAPSYSAGYASSYAAPCTSCAPQQVTMRPICTTCAPACPCDPCSGCSSYGASGVSQASYESGNCASCGVGPSNGTIVVPNGPVAPPSYPSGNGGAQPELAPESQVAPERTYRDRPESDNNQQPIQPEPGGDDGSTGDELEKVLEGDNQDNSTYFEAPRLFNPKDRTARRNASVVRTALYERPVSYHQVSTAQPVTAEQAKRDAAGWVSASN